MGHFSMFYFLRAYVVDIGKIFPLKGFNWELTMSKQVLFHYISSRGPKSVNCKGGHFFAKNRVGGAYVIESFRDPMIKNLGNHFPFTLILNLYHNSSRCSSYDFFGGFPKKCHFWVL